MSDNHNNPRVASWEESQEEPQQDPVGLDDSRKEILPDGNTYATTNGEEAARRYGGSISFVDRIHSSGNEEAKG